MSTSNGWEEGVGREERRRMLMRWPETEADRHSRRGQRGTWSSSFMVSNGYHCQAAALLGRHHHVMIMIRDGGIARRAAI